jgi:hypothetical protein
MLMHLRMSVPDRPGMLAQITAALADVGADIRTIAVLERESGRAIDDIYLSWPEGRPASALTERLASVRGISVLGLRPSRQVPGAFPDIDLLSQVLTTASRGLDTLVDMAALAFGADWAASVSYTSGSPVVLYASSRDDDVIVLPELPVIRPAASERDGIQLAATPLAPFDAVLVCGRSQQPAVHQAELERIRRVTELAVGLVRADAGTVPTASAM